MSFRVDGVADRFKAPVGHARRRGRPTTSEVDGVAGGISSRREEHAETFATRRYDMWCSESRGFPYMVFHAAGSAGSPARGGKREPGGNPGLPRSGERERQPSESCAQARGGNSTGPDQPGKRRPVGSVNGDAAPVSPKTCQRAARDNARGGSGRAGRPTSTAPAQKAGRRLRRALARPGPRSKLARRER